MARKVSKDKKLRSSGPVPAKSPPKKDAKSGGKEKASKPSVPVKSAAVKNGKPAAAAKAGSKGPKEAEKAKKEPVKASADGAKDGAKSAAGVKGKGKEPAAGKLKEAPKPKDAPPKRKRKSSVPRLKAYWGVFNQMLKRVAVFEYAERKQADKKASELSTSSKQPHFVQLVKEVIRDED